MLEIDLGNDIFSVISYKHKATYNRVRCHYFFIFVSATKHGGVILTCNVKQVCLFVLNLMLELALR